MERGGGLDGRGRRAAAGAEERGRRGGAGAGEEGRGAEVWWERVRMRWYAKRFVLIGG